MVFNMANSKHTNAWLASALKAAAKNQREVKRIQAKHTKQPITCGKGWCGKHSELPTDVDWTKIPRTRFNEDKLVKGHNRAIQTVMMEL